MELVSKLNDRNLSFPSRCTLALSLLKPSDSSTTTWVFPRKNQYLFDWFTGSLLKLAKSESPKAEIFLDTSVWELMKEFSLILFKKCENSPSSGLKRSINFITNDEEFFDYRKCFDSQVFVVKCPLLTIFQTALSLLSDGVEEETNLLICSVILRFLQQNRVSLPVSFSQVTDFVRSLVKCKESLPSESFKQILSPSLNILSEIVLGGSANYKKTYPLLVKFCIESAGGNLADEIEIWIEFIKKCLFPTEFHDELLTFLQLIPCDKSKSLDFPKSLTFQKGLFIELSTNIKAVDSCPIIYEAFLRSVGAKINRETGFNFFTFVLRKTLPNNVTSYSTQLAKLISALYERGNEIYQQRNDEIYRKQSAVIEEIFNYAIESLKFEDSDVTSKECIKNSSSFPLLLSLAKLNYYLVAERLNLIFSNNSNSKHVIEFIIGMFELAALANHLPVLLEIIMKSDLSIETLKDDQLQVALIRIFNFNLSPISLHQIYLLLIEELTVNTKTLLLLVPVIRSILKVVDNVESFDIELYANVQRQLLNFEQPEALNLLSEIVRWSPGTFLLIDELFNIGFKDLNLIFTLKCKDPSRISCKSLKNNEESYGLVLKYLPIIADDMESSQLEEFCSWLIRNDKYLCISTLKMIKFYEIKAVREPFISALLKSIEMVDTMIEGCDEASSVLGYLDEIIKLLPWEYLSDEMVIKLIKKRWFTLSNSIPHLLILPSPLNVRKEVLKSLVSTDLPKLVDFLFNEIVEKEGDFDDFLSKCFSEEHSREFVKTFLAKFEDRTLALKIKYVAKMLKYSNFQSEEIIFFIETRLDLVKTVKNRTVPLSVDILNDLDIILEWIVDYRMELVAASIMALPSASSDSNCNNDLEIFVRCQALRCKFPARTDSDFIIESIELASKLSESPVTVTFKKDLLSLIKELPSDQVKNLLEAFLSADDAWKFSLGLQAFNQLLHISAHIPTTFTLFNDNLEKIYTRSLEINGIPAFLAVLKSIIQLKKNVTWESNGISNILGVLRRARQAQPKSFDEIFVTLRFVITLHLRQFRSLLPLLVSNICEAISGGVNSLEESTALGRVLGELGSLRRGELEPFSLLPILHSFITSKYLSSSIRKPLQLSMTNIMYHLGTKKQLLQLMSTALIVEHEHRVILKSFIDDYNKFHKYSGRA
jgi:hypothetical protein